MSGVVLFTACAVWISVARAAPLHRDRAADHESPWLVDLFEPRAGLPGLSVSSLAQTADGILWIGQHGRLVRYDGHSFEPVNTPVELGRQSQVRNIFVEPAGDVWIATMMNGLLSLGPGGSRSFGHQKGLPSPNVARTCRDTRGRLWAGTTNGPAWLDGDHFSTEPNPGAEPWRRRGGNDLLCTNHGVLVAPIGGPPWWIPSTMVGAVPAMPPGSDAYTLLQTRDGLIWLGGIEGGLVSVGPGGQRVYGEADGLPRVRISGLLEDHTGALWIGTWGSGVFRRSRPGQAFTAALTSELPGRTVTALLEDRDHTLWVGTTSGLIHLRPRPFRTVPLPAAFSDSQPRPVLVDRDGALWIGSDGAGVARHLAWPNGQAGLPGKWRQFSVPEGLPSARVFALAQTTDGSVFAGTNRGAARFDGDRFWPLPPGHDLPLREVRSLHADADGGVWMGIGGEGVIHRAKDGTQRYFSGAQGLDASYVTAFATDQNQVLWVGGASIIYRFAGQRFVPEIRLPRPWGAVTALHARPDGTLWAATEAGVVSVATTGHRAVTRLDEGLHDLDLITEIASHGGDTWLLGRNGLRRMATAALTDSFRRGGAAPAMAHFDMTDGLRDADFSYPASPRTAILPDGRFIASSASEVVVSDPVALSHSARIFPPQITALAIDGVPSDPVTPVHLSPGPHRIAFFYTAAAFGHGGRLRFGTSLAGPGGHPATSRIENTAARSMFYENLGPGSYRFSVAVLPDAGGTAAGPAAAIEFRIAAAWHETGWGRLSLGIGVFLTLTLSAAGLRTRHLARRFALLTAERNRISRELHDSVEQNMAGILLRLGAAEQTLPVEHAARTQLGAVRAIIGRVHADIRHQVWALRSATGFATLQDALAGLLRNAAEAGLQTELKVPPGLRLAAAIEARILSAAQELVTNALKHAEAGHIGIEVEAHATSIILIVHDDGQGFIPGELHTTPVQHLGLLGLRERIDEVGGQLVLDSVLGKGTRVRVELPTRVTTA